MYFVSLLLIIFILLVLQNGAKDLAWQHTCIFQFLFLFFVDLFLVNVNFSQLANNLCTECMIF